MRGKRPRDNQCQEKRSPKYKEKRIICFKDRLSRLEVFDCGPQDRSNEEREDAQIKIWGQTAGFIFHGDLFGPHNKMNQMPVKNESHGLRK
jgi:hypothetical protein